MQVNLRNIKKIQIIDSNKKEYTNDSSNQQHTVNNYGRQSLMWYPNDPYVFDFTPVLPPLFSVRKTCDHGHAKGCHFND